MLRLTLFFQLALIGAASVIPNQSDNTIPGFIQYSPISAPPEMFAEGSMAPRKRRRGNDDSDHSTWPCSLPVLKSCQSQFAEDIGEKEDIFKDLNKFSKLIFETYKGPVDGLLKLCKAQVALRSCLGLNYFGCTDPFNIYRDQGKSLGDAFHLAGLYDDIAFDCAGGLTQGTTHWDCVNKVNKNPNYEKTMKDCFEEFRKHMDNPKRFCQAGQELAKCFGEGYKKLDSCVKTDLSWWACERIVRRTKEEGFCHYNTCRSIVDPPEPTEPAALKEPSQQFLDHINSGGLFSETRLNTFRNAEKHFQRRAAANVVKP